MKMACNKNLNRAKRKKNDEFHTQLTDVEKELQHYREHFRDKIVFCNCDDPSYSAFVRYFTLNFEILGLKKVISTHYKEGSSSYKLEITRHIRSMEELNKLPRIPLFGDGDFRSDECIDLLKEADIVCTNPPFSLFREYVAQLIEYEKKFLIIGSYNAVTYKEVFPLIKENRMWLGYSLDGRNIWFRIPDHYEKYHKIEDGIKYAFVAGTVWFTNLHHKKRNEELILFRRYEGHEEDYPKYDNYAAIEISKVVNIPTDYQGVMGVPITFLNKYHPKQFEIIGMAEDNGKGFSGGIWDGKNPHCVVNGKNKFKRIFIKRRQ